MFNVNDFLVYKKEVCRVKEIKENSLDKSSYYVLIPVTDESLKIEVPTANRLGHLRNLISIEEIDNIIKKIPSIKIIEENDRLIENEYKELLKSGTFEDLITIIKTTYLRNKARENTKRKLSDKDNTYFNLAEKYLYTEFSIVLNKSYEDTKKYVEDEVRKLEG
ncbi:MAG: CarD family transcriptional regulator [Bacilli bacterium]|nr:CarD family transcriptional regulator [Bacilli bacterium]